MAISIGPWIVFNNAKLAVHQKKINYASDTFKLALFTSASNIADKTLSPARYADITNELSTTGGYTNGGLSLSSPALAGGGAVNEITWDTADGVFTGSGGGFGPFRYIGLYDNTATDKDMIAYAVMMDTITNTPTNVSIVASQNFTVTVADVFGIAG